KAVTQVFDKETGRKASDFSYKTKASQSAHCQGIGSGSTSLDIAAEQIEVCDVCGGARYQKAILAYAVAGKHIADVLALNLEELAGWMEPYTSARKAVQLLQALCGIGLHHVRADQTVKSL